MADEERPPEAAPEAPSPSALDGPPAEPAPYPRMALRRVRTPTSIRTVARVLLTGAVFLFVALMLLPWQQTARGAGRVIAYAPAHRQQIVEAPVAGRIAAFYVTEGQRVVEGQPLVEIRDPDPGYLERLLAQEERLVEQIEAIGDQVDAYETRLGAERGVREQAVGGRAQEIEQARQRLDAAQARLVAARSQLERVQTLAAEGIASTRELELARAELESAQADVEAAQAGVEGAVAAREQAREAGTSAVAGVETQLESARADLAALEAERLELQVEIARQRNQVVRAPRDGTVLELRGAPGSSLVSQGAPLLTLVPEGEARAVELSIDGSDLPLVERGTPVRLVFEGWPAIQFAGWPDLDTGTFSGVVAFVDATGNADGTFRVVVVPDPTEDPWPPPERLRQGVRAKAFVLLGRVSLGYELWRQLHDFPPLPPEIEDEVEKPATPKRPRTPPGLSR